MTTGCYRLRICTRLDSRGDSMENQRAIGMALFEQQYDRIVRLIDVTAARRRLDRSERDELYSQVMLRIVEDDFAALRAFQERSSWRTYLVVLIQRSLLDIRVEKWGRWRPSARSQRLGPTAVLLDRRINRDGFAPDEAIADLLSRGVAEDAAALEALADQIPRRGRRWFLREDEQLMALPSRQRADAEVEATERRRNAERIRAMLAAALELLSSSDRRLLALRFGQRWSVRRIADALSLEARPLYRRFERIKRRLRCHLTRHGCGWQEVREILGCRDVDLAVGLPVARTIPMGASQEDPRQSLDLQTILR